METFNRVLKGIRLSSATHPINIINYTIVVIAHSAGPACATWWHVSLSDLGVSMGTHIQSAGRAVTFELANNFCSLRCHWIIVVDHVSISTFRSLIYSRHKTETFAEFNYRALKPRILVLIFFSHSNIGAISSVCTSRSHRLSHSYFLYRMGEAGYCRLELFFRAPWRFDNYGFLKRSRLSSGNSLWNNLVLIYKLHEFVTEKFARDNHVFSGVFHPSHLGNSIAGLVLWADCAF